MSLVIRRAEEADLQTIQGLLQGANVHAGGVAEILEQFLLVEQVMGEEEKEVVGTVGLEILEEKYGVMRSMVLQTKAWNGNIGAELLRLFVAYAETTQIEELYLFTKSTATPLFIHMGFSTIGIEGLPSPVSQCSHALAYRNSDAVAMVKVYKSTSYPQGDVDTVNK